MLTIRDLSISYPKKTVLDHVSYSFADGQITAITGTSGIGKTTLLRVISGLLSPTDGAIESSYQRIAYIFQEPRLFPWMTALENVTEVCKDPEKAKHFLSALLPDTEAHDKYPHELSGGMKQRVSIARALSYDPDLLLMDEPFKGLDSETREQVTALLFKEIQGKTAILVTHDERDLPFCHQILRMEGFPANCLILEKSNNASLE